MYHQKYKTKAFHLATKTSIQNSNPLASPSATPAMRPHCQGDPPGNDHQVQNPIKFRQILRFNEKTLVTTNTVITP